MAPRIPDQSITSSSPIVLPEGHPDLLFLNPNKVLIKSGETFVYSKYLSGAPVITGNGAVTGEAAISTAQGTLSSTLDTPQLSDIEIKSTEQYYDPVSKLAKYKVILKVRNSSINPANVQGIDARIYNPNGA